MFFELTEHYFIAKKQSEFLRVKKTFLRIIHSLFKTVPKTITGAMFRQQSIPLFYFICIPKQKKLSVLRFHLSTIICILENPYN